MTPKAIIDAAVDRITENKFFFVLVVVDWRPGKTGSYRTMPINLYIFRVIYFSEKISRKIFPK
jgi:hypothetical protein